jgi:hypothetical protein
MRTARTRHRHASCFLSSMRSRCTACGAHAIVVYLSLSSLLVEPLLAVGLQCKFTTMNESFNSLCNWHCESRVHLHLQAVHNMHNINWPYRIHGVRLSAIAAVAPHISAIAQRRRRRTHTSGSDCVAIQHHKTWRPFHHANLYSERSQRRSIARDHNNSARLNVYSTYVLRYTSTSTHARPPRSQLRTRPLSNGVLPGWPTQTH